MSEQTIRRVRLRFAAAGLQAALEDKPHAPTGIEMKAEQEARLIALACSEPGLNHFGNSGSHNILRNVSELRLLDPSPRQGELVRERALVLNRLQEQDAPIEGPVISARVTRARPNV